MSKEESVYEAAIIPGINQRRSRIQQSKLSYNYSKSKGADVKPCSQYRYHYAGVHFVTKS